MQNKRHTSWARAIFCSIALLASAHIAAAQTSAPATQPAVTMISIHLQQAVPEDIFAELSKQSGVKFSSNGNIWDQDAMQTPLDIVVDQKPFWAAVKEICSKTGISMQQNYGMNNSGKRIMIQYLPGQPPDWDAYPSVETSGVLVQARGFSRQQNIDYGHQQRAQDYCSIELMAYVDPAVHVQTFNPNVHPETAVDDAGNSMMPDRGAVMYGGQSQRGLIYDCHVPLKYPAHPGQKIADLKCTLTMKVGEKLDSLAVDNPLNSREQSKTFGDLTIEFDGLKKSGVGYECKISLSRDGDSPNPFNDQWSLLQSAQLLDAKGRALSFGGGGGGGVGQNGMASYTINYNSMSGIEADRAGEPTRWIIELPTQTHTVKLPVEFKDLAIPQ